MIRDGETVIGADVIGVNLLVQSKTRLHPI